jgi:hypothetical protein
MSFVAYLEQQPNTQAAISSSTEATNALQQLCQKTFKALQGDRFFIDFVTNMSKRLVSI